MKIKEVKIKNFRGISEVTFELFDKLNVFVGVNGSGKTTVLDALATSLSWLVNRIQRENSSGRPITESSIKNETSFSSIELSVNEQDKNYKWKLTKTAKGEAYTEKSDLAQVSELASHFQISRRQKSTLPVFAYYPINRVVNSTTPEFLGKDSIDILDVYDNALDGKTNYRSFFEWFRLQDDIVNEQSQSRAKWMIKNKDWVRNKIKKLLVHLEEIGKNGGAEYDYQKERLFDFDKNDFVYEQPRYLFLELMDLVHFSNLSYKNNWFEFAFRDVKNMLHKMSTLSDSRKDNLIEFNNFQNSIIKNIIEQITELKQRKDFDEDSKMMISFIWDALSLSVLLSLWWLRTCLNLNQVILAKSIEQKAS